MFFRYCSLRLHQIILLSIHQKIIERLGKVPNIYLQFFRIYIICTQLKITRLCFCRIYFNKQWTIILTKRLAYFGFFDKQFAYHVFQNLRSYQYFGWLMMVRGTRVNRALLQNFGTTFTGILNWLTLNIIFRVVYTMHNMVLWLSHNYFTP